MHTSGKNLYEYQDLNMALPGFLAIEVFSLPGCRKDNPGIDNPTGDATEVGVADGIAVTGSIGSGGHLCRTPGWRRDLAGP